MDKSKVALIVGATGALGRAVFGQLLPQKADIVIHYHQGEEIAKNLEDDANILGVNTLRVQADISSEEQVAQMMATIKKHFGRLDFLINCSGIIKDYLLVFMSVADWTSVMDVNLKGTFLCAREALKIMLRQKEGGKIINVSSGVGMSGNAGQANYAASKAGIIALSKSIAQECQNKNIKVNCIVPGAISGGMSEPILHKSDYQSNQIVTPEYVANIIVDILYGDKTTGVEVFPEFISNKAP